jgi:hypothetical protein
MARIEDYLPGGSKDPNAGGDLLQGNIEDAQQQQQHRQERPRDPETGQFVSSAPPPTDWETRYKELEKLNSRQAQTLGEQRRIIDSYIMEESSTPGYATPQEPPSPITADELYEDPEGALNRAVERHPAIQEARKIREQFEAQQRDNQFHEFTKRHPDYSDIGATPEFQNWVADDPTRVELYNRGNQYDFSAADALFRLYKAETGIAQAQQRQDIETAELVSSSGEHMPAEPPKYSRSEYVGKLMRAKQGDLDAEDWIKRNAAGYRQALATGNVRD